MTVYPSNNIPTFLKKLSEDFTIFEINTLSFFANGPYKVESTTAPTPHSAKLMNPKKWVIDDTKPFTADP